MLVSDISKVKYTKLMTIGQYQPARFGARAGAILILFAGDNMPDKMLMRVEKLCIAIKI